MSRTDHPAMVEAMSPHWSHLLACSESCRDGAIAAGPRQVLLPPRGPGDLPRQLMGDVARLQACRQVGHGGGGDGQGHTEAAELGAPADAGDDPDWAGVPIGSLTAHSQLIARQLDPVRTRESLLSSYLREAAHPPELRLAYAMVWLALGRGAAPGLPGLIARQLQPVRTRESLLSSYLREAAHGPALRLAYAMAWLALGRGAVPALPGLIARRRGRRTVAGAR
jgi:hypothetical protein